jgi:hypothetical protein
MALKLSSLKKSRKLLEAGDWITYYGWADQAGKKPRFKVSALSSDAYQAVLVKSSTELALKYKGEPIPPDVAHRIDGELLAEHILHDWDGLDEPYSKDRAEELLTDRDYEALFHAVSWCAKKISDLNLEFVEDAEKNSAAPSVTS